MTRGNHIINSKGSGYGFGQRTSQEKKNLTIEKDVREVIWMCKTDVSMNRDKSNYKLSDISIMTQSYINAVILTVLPAMGVQ